MPDIDLTNTTVVITGATGRLGQRMLRPFAEHGATLAAIARDPDRIPFPAEATGATFAADLTREETVEACFQQIGEQFGTVDVLVHTVGMWAGQPLLDTSLEDWNRLVQINLTSTFLCFREAVRRMGNHGGRLIAIASGQGADGGVAQQGAYSAAKAGVIRLVEAVADEFANQRVTAHAIAPSMILFGDADQQGVSAERIVDLALYLCSPAGDALNGATLRAYGTLR